MNTGPEVEGALARILEDEGCRVHATRALWIAALAGLFAAIALGAADADTTVPTGTVSTDTTWSLAGSPYSVEGNVTVTSGATLTIDAGVSVLFADGMGLEIRGGLLVEGTQSAPVSFQPNTSAARWSGLYFNASSSPCALQNASILSTADGASVRNPTALVTFTDVEITDATNRSLFVFSASNFFMADSLTVSTAPEGVRVESSNNVPLRSVGASNLTAAGCAICWVDSDDGFIGNSTLTTGTGIKIEASNRVRVVNVTAIRLDVTSSGNVTVEDSAFGATLTAASFYSASDILMRNTTLNSFSNYAFYAENSRNLTLDRANLRGYSDNYGAVRALGVNILRVINSSACDTRGFASVGASSSTDILVFNLSACPGPTGVFIVGSTRAVVQNSTLNATVIGVSYIASSQVTVKWNKITNASYAGVYADAQSGTANVVYENEFWDNLAHAEDYGTSGQVTWYNATTRRGNFWDNYTGADANGDHIGDSSIGIRGGPSRDLYPLMTPWDPEPPVARIWLPSEVNEDTVVALDGTNSTDNLGITRAVWNLTQNTTAGNRTGLSATFVFATPGTALVTLRVFDAWNRSSTANATVLVLDTTPPAFGAATPLIVDEDTAAAIPVNVSDNHPAWPQGASFEWRLVGGWASLDFATNTTAAFLNFTFEAPGLYTVSVTVRDASGLANNTTFSVTVRDRTAPSFGLQVTRNATVLEQEAVSFEIVNASDADPTFPTFEAFQWSAAGPGGDIDLGSASTDSAISFVADRPGNYTVTYIARDPSGNFNASTYAFEALDAFPPTWAAPGPFTMRDTDTLNLSATDAFDWSGVDAVEWVVGGVPFASGLNATFRSSTPGNHTIDVRLVDPFGHEARFQVSVAVFDNTPPVLIQSQLTNPRTVAQREALDFDASTAFSDNDPEFPARGSFTWSTQPLGAEWLSGQSTAVASLRFPAPGFYNVTLRVADSAANQVTVMVPVTVLDIDAPTDLTVLVSPGQSVDVNTTLMFTGAAIDAAPVAFSWNFSDGGFAEGPTASHDYNVSGNYTVEVRATDTAGNFARLVLNVTVRAVVEPDTTPPTITVTADRTAVFVGTRVNFTGGAIDGGSPITDGARFNWTFTYNGSLVTLHGLTASFTFSAAGSYVVTLTVADLAGNSGSNQVAVIVTEPVVPPPPPPPPAGLALPLLLALTAAAGAVAFVLLRRRRPKTPSPSTRAVNSPPPPRSRESEP